MPLQSWIDAANTGDTDFPLENLPFGVFSTDGAPRCGIAIGDRILDAAALEASGILRADPDRDVLAAPDWNAFMALGPDAWARYRAALTLLLRDTADAETRAALAPHLVAMQAAQLHLPLRVSEFTDFYASKHHASNVGTMFRGPENALPPNWLSMPIGYNGRASSVVVSGTPVTRPWGQIRPRGADLPRFAPCARFDFELELGAVVGQPSGRPVTVAEAEAMIFGYVLLNDWSARDIQAWEYQPLGPFQSKATATTISPWIVPKPALEPFRIDTPPRDRPLLPHLQDDGAGLYDITLSVDLAPAGRAPTTIARTTYAQMYYSSAQQLAHHTTSGCPMRTGDLLGSGTVSGPGAASRGALLELAWGGETPITLDTGETRAFLQDGDTVTLRGAAQGDGYRIGFGPCSGTVMPAKPDPYAP